VSTTVPASKSHDVAPAASLSHDDPLVAYARVLTQLEGLGLKFEDAEALERFLEEDAAVQVREMEEV
jgi:hypothetical protein